IQEGPVRERKQAGEVKPLEVLPLRNVRRVKAERGRDPKSRADAECGGSDGARIGDDIGSIGEAAVIFACDLGARVRHHSYQVESGRRCAGSGTSRSWVDRRAPA